MKRKAFRKRIVFLLAGLIGWLALMCSPIGDFVAVSTILVLIVVFFVIGFIDIHPPTDRF